MRKLYRYLKPSLPAAVLAPLFMMGEVFMDLFMPALMSQAIDKGVMMGDGHFILITCLKMAAYGALGMLGGGLCAYFSTIAGFGFAQRLRSALFEKVQSFSFADLDRFKTGSLVTRLTNDITQIQNALQAAMRILVRAPLMSIGGVVMVVSISRRLALVLLLVMPLLALVITLIMRRAFPLFEKVQKRLDGLNTVVQENLAGVRVIKAFGRAGFEKGRFGQANDALMGVNRQAMRIMAISFPLVTFIMNMTVVFVYWMGGGMVFEGALTVGEIMAFSQYVMQILFSLMMSSFILVFISRAKVSVDRVNEVLEVVPDIQSPENARELAVTRGEVVFEDVTFSYPGQSGPPVLENISFKVSPGQTLAILGSTGSGKTTLVSLIPRLYDVSHGRVLVDGQDVRSYPLQSLRQGIGVALQESVLFTGTVAENLRWGDENAADEEVAAAARIAQADGFLQGFENGYETMLGQRGVNLSGGQKQRLSIARALLKRPRILILDDSTSAVDMATEREIQRRLRENAGEMTVLVIAQRISSVIDADEILVMDNGRIVGRGTHDRLVKDNEVYREIVISQLGKEAV